MEHELTEETETSVWGFSGFFVCSCSVILQFLQSVRDSTFFSFRIRVIREIPWVLFLPDFMFCTACKDKDTERLYYESERREKMTASRKLVRTVGRRKHSNSLVFRLLYFASSWSFISFLDRARRLVAAHSGALPM